jgi:3',5'-cyclic-AMP phosphodiesterase
VQDVILIAHLSDLHLDTGERAYARARRMLDHLDAMHTPPDVVLVTGDIADHGLPAEYEEAAKLLTGRPGTLVCPGNHDERTAFRAAFADVVDEAGPASGDGSPAPVNTVRHVAGVRFLLCDSSIPGRHDGWLEDVTLEWLDAALDAAPDLPALVCFHHPPVLLHSPFLDGIRQFGTDRLESVLGRHPQVRGVLCGHAHTAGASTFAGRPLRAAPGVVSTLRFPWESGPELDYDLPPGLAYHVLDDDGTLTTHYRFLP